MAAPVVDILMYHSISDAGGATAILPEVFAAQMQAIADAAVPVITLDDLVAARAGRRQLAPRSVIVTFDDGFQDFADVAWPVLVEHGFPAIVYLPTGFVGRAEGWRGSAEPPRSLMHWPVIRSLADQGAIFGSHTICHPDLNTLPEAALEAELQLSRAAIEEALGHPIRHFAPPYGRARTEVRTRIARHYDTSVGTALGSARLADDIFNLPRLEMYYFTDPAAWRRHLAGRGAPYLALRKTLRAVRGSVLKPWNHM